MRMMIASLLAVGCYGQSTAALLWRELGPVLVDRKAVFTLPGGKRVQGEVLAVRDEGIVLHVEKSSSRSFARGQALVPRSAVSTVKVIRENGPLKLVGGIVGTVGGGVLVAVIGIATGGTGALPAALLLWPVAGVGGYYGGKAADRRTRTIQVIPEADIHD